MRFVFKALRPDGGGTAIEYALLSALIAGTILIALSDVGSSFAATLESFAKAM